MKRRDNLVTNNIKNIAKFNLVHSTSKNPEKSRWRSLNDCRKVYIMVKKKHKMSDKNEVCQ